MTLGELKEIITNHGEGFDNFDHALSIVTDGNFNPYIGRRFHIDGKVFTLKRGYLEQLEFFEC